MDAQSPGSAEQNASKDFADYVKPPSSEKLTTMRAEFMQKEGDHVLGKIGFSEPMKGEEFFTFYEKALTEKLTTDTPDDEQKRKAILNFIAEPYRVAGYSISRKGTPEFVLWYQNFPARNQALKEGISVLDPRKTVGDYMNEMLLEATRAHTDDLMINTPTLLGSLRYALAYTEASLYGKPAKEFMDLHKTLEDKYLEIVNKVKLPLFDSFRAGRFLETQHARVQELFAHAPAQVRESIEQKWTLYEAALKEQARNTLFSRKGNERN